MKRLWDWAMKAGPGDAYLGRNLFVAFTVAIIMCGFAWLAAELIRNHYAAECHDRGGVLVRAVCFDPKVLR